MRGLWVGVAVSLVLVAYGVSPWPGHLLVALVAGVPLLAAWYRWKVKLLESQKADQGSRLDAVLATATDGLVVTDLENRIVLVNPVFEQLAATSARQLIGRSLEMVMKDKRLTHIVDQTLSDTGPVFARVYLYEQVFEASARAIRQDFRTIGTLLCLRSLYPPDYQYRESPFPRPRSTVSLNEVFSWFFPADSYRPRDPDINPVAHKCRNLPAYAGNMGPEGSAETETGKALYTLVRLIRPRNVIEIGPYAGASSICMAQALLDNSDGGLLHCIEIEDENISLAMDHLREASLEPQVRFYHGSSHDPGVVHSLPRSEVIFVDGDHTHQGAKRDFEIYRDLLTDDGMMVYHDSVKIMALQRLMHEIAQSPEYDTFSIATSDGDGITLIRKRLW